MEFLDQKVVRLDLWIQAHGAKVKHPALLNLRFMEESGQWQTSPTDLQWKSKRPALFDVMHCDTVVKNLTSLLQMIVNGFSVFGLDSIPVTESSFRAKIHHVIIKPEDFKNSYGVFRYHLLGYHRPEWPEIWSILKNRSLHDPQMVVDGFTRKQLNLALTALEKFLPWDWVRARYAEATAKGIQDVKLYEDIQHDYERWFPVACLVRAANGFLCKDPALTALASLGLQIDEIRQVEGWDKLLPKIGHRGFMYQALLASRFASLGELVELERQAGNTQDDIVVGKKAPIALEIKTVKAQKLTASYLNRTMKNKAKKMPNSRSYPLFLVVFPLEEGFSKDEIDQLAAENAKTPSLEDITNAIKEEELDFPPNIAGVLICECFVDGTGPVRFDTLRLLKPTEEPEAKRLSNFIRDSSPKGLPQFRLPHLMNFVMPPITEE